MKAKNTIKSLLTDTVAILGFCLFVGGSQATVLTQQVAQAGAGDGLALDTSPQDGVANSITTNSQNVQVGDNTANGLSRGIFKFDLPAIPSGEVFASASLGYRYQGKSGTPAADLDIILFRSTTNVVELADYGNVTDAVTFPSQLTVSSAIGTYALNSTSLNAAIANAYASSQAFVSFRFELSGVASSDGNGANDYYTLGAFENTTAAFHPTLLITTVPQPEPATLSLFITGALVWLGSRRTKRHCTR